MRPLRPPGSAPGLCGFALFRCCVCVFNIYKDTATAVVVAKMTQRSLMVYHYGIIRESGLSLQLMRNPWEINSGPFPRTQI